MAARAALCLAGAALSLYALHVERAHARDPSYRAACDLGPAVSCTRVFASRWGRGLGLVEVVAGRDNAVASFPNGPILGRVHTAARALVVGAVPGRVTAAALLGTSVASAMASLWLAGVLAFGLWDFCLVCITTYVLNGFLLALNWRRWRRLRRLKTA
ncbi:vitamin K epoxide reductase complex subunit 1-like [Aquila chrysaetos chrysaetos]|uniref:vitamin-K-epoxide reductase (warfarin-sensitive) n=1 Tax=Aquila chrysaetos chrysaetos TaxID=223781 RepID=A0A663FH53_AQUCH|nr:vitamin K epoxide reductase complex subunit 1-like [Aquila chrysaetos chrysaetos]